MTPFLRIPRLILGKLLAILLIILPLRLAKSPNYLILQRLLISLFQMEIAELVISWLCY